MRHRMFAAAILVAGAGGLAACGDGQDMAATSGAPTTTSGALPAVIVPASALPGNGGDAEPGIQSAGASPAAGSGGAPSAGSAASDASAIAGADAGEVTAAPYGERG